MPVMSLLPHGTTVLLGVSAISRARGSFSVSCSALQEARTCQSRGTAPTEGLRSWWGLQYAHSRADFIPEKNPGKLQIACLINFEELLVFFVAKKKNNPTKNKAPKIKNLASSIAQNLLKTPSEKFPKIKHKRQYT